MIKSMTGYAKVRGAFNDSEYFIEIKSVNNRYLDFNIRIPGFISAIENRLKSIIREYVKRGTVTITFNFLSGNPNQNIEINSKLLKEYIEKTNNAVKDLGYNNVQNVEFFLQQQNVINFVNDELDIEKFLSSIMPNINKLLNDLNETREIEGKSLIKDMKKRIEIIVNKLEDIKGRAVFDTNEKILKLKEKLNQFTETNSIDENRLAQEVFYYAEKSDITEEIVRLESHIKELKNLIATESEIGKKGTFTLQEMHREINTIASKTSDYNISKNTIDVKQEIEKIREQMQNLE